MRLIPARAGKTIVILAGAKYPPAHPRSRGENAGVLWRVYGGVGSSPLARGKHSVLADWAGDSRLIPARAGKTIPALSTGASCRAHPRSRGENVLERVEALPGPGSSPLARGKQALHGKRDGLIRLIPARAGKTTILLSSSPASGLIPARAGKTPIDDTAHCRMPAHPRSRGENHLTRGLIAAIAGSSPLARGKHTPASWNRDARRLIPARAGKTIR